jgi:hypothetical protein
MERNAKKVTSPKSHLSTMTEIEDVATQKPVK